VGPARTPVRGPARRPGGRGPSPQVRMRRSGRISLGMKQLSPDPWQDLPAHYPVGARVRGKVVSLTDYGAFVELEEGVEGSSTSARCRGTKKGQNPAKLLAVGDTVGGGHRRREPRDAEALALAARRPSRNPWEMLAEKFRIGDRIQGVVRNLDRLLRRLRRDRGGDRRPRPHLPTCPGGGASSTRRRS